MPGVGLKNGLISGFHRSFPALYPQLYPVCDEGWPICCDVRYSALTWMSTGKAYEHATYRRRAEVGLCQAQV